MSERSSGAERARRYRVRQRAYLSVLPIEADPLLLAEALIQRGYLDERRKFDFPAVLKAAATYLQDSYKQP